MKDDDLQAAVEEFISADPSIDGEAAEALRTAETAVQKEVLGRGNLSTARNPSSVLLARIREAAQRASECGSSRWIRLRGMPYNSNVEDVVQFFSGYGVAAEHVVMGFKDGRSTGEAFAQFDADELAHEALETRNRADMGGRYIELFAASNAEVDRAIADAAGSRQDSYGGRDDRDDRGGANGLDGDVPFTNKPKNVEASRGDNMDQGDLDGEVDDFIHRSALDDNASQALRDCTPAEQRHVLDRGELGGARNPSSVLLSRIRDAKKELGGEPHKSQGGDDHGAWGGGSGGTSYSGHQSSRSGGDRYNSGGDSHNAPPWQSPRWDAPKPLASQTSVYMPIGLLDDLENFVKANARGERDTWAQELLAQIDSIRHGGKEPLPPQPPVQQYDQHAPRELIRPYQEQRNARAEVRPYEQNRSRGGGDYQSRGSRRDDRREDSVAEQFLRDNPDVDSSAAEAFRRCPLHVQEYVAEKGIRGARNPSSALLARIKECDTDHSRRSSPDRDRRGAPGGGRFPPSGSRRKGDEHEEFLSRYNIDERAAAAFWRADSTIQRTVMDKGLDGARNPSSALQARLNQLEQELSQRRGGPRANSPPRGGGGGFRRERYEPY